MADAGSPRDRYEAGSYWKDRLERDFNLVGVGYRSFGAAFNRWQYRAYLRNLEWAEKRFGFDLGANSILECGFGTGFFLDYYKRRGNGNFAGLDLTQISVDSARARFPEQDFRQADLGAGPIDLGSTFDVVTAFAVLLHITDDAMFAQAVENMCRHSSRWILISDLFPHERFEHGAASHNVVRSHNAIRSLGEYEGELAKHGFEIAGTVPIFAFLTVPRPDLRWWFYLWSGILRVLTLTEFTGNVAGAFFYALDGILLRAFGLDVSLRLLVARRK